VNPKRQLVSFIMPVWRPRADWLRQCTESVLAQRDCELELILIDDGNLTPVEGLLDWLEDRRVSVLRELHAGASHARNVGLRVATGSQIRFVDADDVVEPGSTARLQKLIGQDSDTIAYGTTVLCDEHMRVLRRRYESTLEGDVSKQYLLGEFEVRHLSMLFPRTIIERTGEWSSDFAVSADRDFVQRALEHGPVRGEQAIATFYRRHRLSIQGQANIASGEAASLKVVARYIERHPHEAGSRLHRKAIANILLDRARAFAHVGMFGAALSRAARAAAYAPARASRTAAGIAWRRLKLLTK
jgi:glycosyltransferase involved in cell wall biosynthesis